ncbi:MAG: FkbM family methyltransferase [Alphaproteobacteria bacterium]|nr:FkbM family methyltransferase [Alphaproteobacteria bacterium]
MKKQIKAILVRGMSLLFGREGSKWNVGVKSIVREALSMKGFDESTVSVQTSRGEIGVYCVNDMTRWRAETMLSKEPETIEWINSFTDGDVLYDIGANVGIYSLYAAANRKIRVFSFEPLAANYFLINKNIEINNLQDNITAFCIALNDEDLVSELHIQNTGFGSALSSFDTPVDHNGDQFFAKFKQGMIGMGLDNFIAKFTTQFPTHVKIDVDGIEDKIIKGAQATLSDARLKSLSVELDEDRPDYTNQVIADIEAAGLKLHSKRHAGIFEGTEYSNIYNYQFRRFEGN